MAYLKNPADYRSFVSGGLSLHKAGAISEHGLVSGLQVVYDGSSATDRIFLEQLYTTMVPHSIIKQLKFNEDNTSNYKTTFNYGDLRNETYNYNILKRYSDKMSVELPDILKDDGASTTMIGTDYIKSSNVGRNYTHMRRMLHKLYDMNNTHPSNRVDADTTFRYNCDQIAAYLVSKFDPYQINSAHDSARSDYRKRGRPENSRNKAHVFGKTTNTEAFDPLALPDMSPDEIELELKADDVTPKPEAGSEGVKLDASQFVPWSAYTPRMQQVETNVNATVNNVKKIQIWGLEVDDRLKSLENRAATVIEIKPAPEMPTVKLGIQHRNFPKLLKMVQAREPSGFPIIPWVYGPAGTGKTTACENVAKALQLPFYTMGTTLAKFEILGFVNTTGYQSTPFRQAYEHGGVFCADEMDSWAKEATVAINGALANGCCNFADQTIKRHPNFIFIAAANTVGAGATMDYAGRNKQDGATLDRVRFLSWPIDEALEDSLCSNKDWLRYVRHVRNRANASGINPKPMITPRASMGGPALLAVGLDWADVVDMCLRKGLSDQQWNQIK